MYSPWMVLADEPAWSSGAARKRINGIACIHMHTVRVYGLSIHVCMYMLSRVCTDGEGVQCNSCCTSS